MKIRTFFQVTFCILSVLSVVLAVILGVVLGLVAALYGFAAAVLFAALMLLCKYCIREPKEEKPDFLNTPEENARILSLNADKQDDPLSKSQSADNKEDSSPEDK